MDSQPVPIRNPVTTGYFPIVTQVRFDLFTDLEDFLSVEVREAYEETELTFRYTTNVKKKDIGDTIIVEIDSVKKYNRLCEYIVKLNEEFPY